MDNSNQASGGEGNVGESSARLHAADRTDALEQRVGKLEALVERLAASVDTGWRPEILPEPDGARRHDEQLSGPLWEPVKGWRVHAHQDTAEDISQLGHEEGEGLAYVYVNTPHSWHDDVIPVSPAEARKLAQTYWAAADYADRLQRHARSNSSSARDS